MGPGLVVMLADTDAGSLITAAQSGAVWGYQLLLAQLVLIPILYLAQELTVRLGIVTQRGHGELIRERFGRVWAWIAVSTLVVACAGAIVSEMAGITGVGHIWGIPGPVSVAAVVVFLMAVVVTGIYRRVERIAIAIGAFELVFLVVMIWSRPDPEQVAEGLVDIPLADPAYLYLLAANIGAVIMPWMIFF
jgi:NRAMP (natural resistance-associated macrophage protein)-like metal ion transporter